jgi:hypothetical protein
VGEVLIARTVPELDPLRPLWARMRWDQPEAELDVFLTLVTKRPGVLHPYVVAVEHESEPAAMAIGRVELTQLTTKVGYRTLYEPTVRSLATIYGGVASRADTAIEPLLRSLEAPLRAGEADLLSLRGLRVGSELHKRALELAGRFRRQHFTSPTEHWQLALPETFDDFLATRPGKSRRGDPLRRKRLVTALGTEPTIAVLSSPDDLDRIFGDIERVAAKTYQRALGTGFDDTPERRARIETCLAKGWFRAWIMYRGDTPIAFWYGLANREVFVAVGTGYDPAYQQQRIGVYLLMHVIQDLCADPVITTLDFGPGDSALKRQFGNDGWTEQDVVVFAPTSRALRINATQTSILALDLLAKRTLAATGMTDRVKKLWRSSMRDQTG